MLRKGIANHYFNLKVIIDWTWINWKSENQPSFNSSALKLWERLRCTKWLKWRWATSKKEKKKGHSYPVAVLLICGKYVNNNSTTGSSGILGYSKWHCQENKTKERHTFYTVGDVPCATLLCCSSFREAGHQGMQLWNGEIAVSLERQKHLGIRYLIHSHSCVTAALPVTGSMQTCWEAMSH